MSPQGFSPGDVVLVQFPFTDLSGVKLRPAVAVAIARPPDLVLAFITSNVGNASAFDVTLEPADVEFALSGLHVPSRIRADRLATLEAALVRRRLGSLGPKSMERVRAALRDVFGL